MRHIPKVRLGRLLKQKTEANMNNEKIQGRRNNKPWIILENGKKRYTRATAIDIILSIVIPIIGPVFGLIALIKKEYKRGWTMIAIGLVHIIIRVIMVTN